MGKFSLFGMFRKNNEKSPIFRRNMAARLHGMSVRYITERTGDGVNADGSYTDDYVIGRGGSIAVIGGEIVVYSSTETVFRSKVELTDLGELMSGDGVILEGEDLEHGGVNRRIIAYFTYHLRQRGEK